MQQIDQTYKQMVKTGNEDLESESTTIPEVEIVEHETTLQSKQKKQW
jgi:hypothetical protein